MIAYVESNFILELALDQEESGSAEELLALGEASAIELSLPSFCLSEPFSATTRKGNVRNALQEPLIRQIRELRRSRRHQDVATRLNDALADFRAVTERELEALEAVLTRILRVATIVPMDGRVYAASLGYKPRFGMSAQDAIVLASVVSDLGRREATEEKCFISRNARDFDDPNIEAELGSRGCRYISRFTDAVGYIKSRLSPDRP
jgi:predicted nucleic acid-binding protein